MGKYLFNSSFPRRGASFGFEPSDIDRIESTPNLRQAGLNNAVLFGGPLLKDVLEQAPVHGDKQYVVVDTKVSMLMPGMIPAIPGWHTDGVPRTPKPNMYVQQAMSKMGNETRYHTIILGNDCQTEFINQPLELEVGSDNIYQQMNLDLAKLEFKTTQSNLNEWISWDWWQIHRATRATNFGFRLLVRVTESDTLKPREDNFIRAQTQVYVPDNFGW